MVFSGGTKAVNGSVINQKSHYLAPTLKLEDPAIDALQFQQDRGSSSTQSSRGLLSQRILNPMGVDAVNEVSYKVHVPNFASLSPSKLASKYITDLVKIDSMIPDDLYSDENVSKSGSGLDNYYFDYNKGLGEFSRFEKITQLDLPEKFFDEHNSTESATKMGLFAEIERAWITVDNKLILWNYRVPQSSFNHSTQFLVIDQIRHTILQVKLAKPKPNIFVKEVNYILIVATTQDIHIFVVKFDEKLSKLEVFNSDLSVSVHGFIVNTLAVNNRTNEIFFTGEGDGINVWRLDYSNKSSFIRNKCEKVCLTKSGISSVLPIGKLQGFDFFSSEAASKSTSLDSYNNLAHVPETIVQLEIDAQDEILYSLSNKSVIRCYKLQTNQDQFTLYSQITPSEIFRSVQAMFVDSSNFKAFLKFRIVSILSITKMESSKISLIAITNYGYRILLKFGLGTSFSSTIASFISHPSSSSSRLKLAVSAIKFPPSREVPQINPELDAFTRMKQYQSQLIANQQKSQLLKNTKFSKIISPGVFLCVKRTKKSDKLFVCTANYGFLKKNRKLVEDAEFIKYVSNEEEPYTYIYDIIQLNSSMNATDTPSGYANILASQYTKEPLKFVVLTNFGIMIYQFRTSEKVLKSLDDSTIENFIEENGYEETCSTLLYLACSYSHNGTNDILYQKARVFFSTCGNNARLLMTPQDSVHNAEAIDQLSLPTKIMSQISGHVIRNSEGHPTVEHVVLSDRFYGTCLLVARLFREFWNKKVFLTFSYIKFNAKGEVDVESVKEDNLLIEGIKITRTKVEFFIGSMMVLIDFFSENGNKIPGLNAPIYSSDPNKFENEVCMRAEHIAFTSLIKSLVSMKEALSFLMILIEESQVNETNFSDIMKALSLVNQLNLSNLRFRDLLLPNQDVKNLIKDLLSSIINKNILKGGSIDSIASSLQGRCESFCSVDDVYIFKALENLTRAKNIGNRDNDLRIKCLKNASSLFEEAYESLTYENIQNSINIILELEYYTGAVELLLKLASKFGSSLSVNSNSTQHQRKLLLDDYNNSKINGSLKMRDQLYELVFKILSKVDLRTFQASESKDQLEINDIAEVRDSCYKICFASKDKSFHYEFYNWFIKLNAKERLLDIDTPYILPFLEKESENNLDLRNLLWLYHAKRENYYAAANILYTLAISEFKLTLEQRIEYLSRANGFCNCICPPNLRQRMIELSSTIQELFEVANVQLDVLNAVKEDSRISDENRNIAVTSLNFKVLSISDLFNDYTDPLGYYDLCLIIFKVSDYRNTDDILKRWELVFERIFHEFSNSKKKEPFYVVLSNAFTVIGPRLSSNDLVFPVDELIKLVSKYLHEAVEENSVIEKPPRGIIVDIFNNSGVSYDKIYYIMRSLIENDTYEIYEGFSEELKTNEMVYLIQEWYNTDKKLREIIPSDQIRQLTEYTLQNDPINKYIKEHGILD